MADRTPAPERLYAANAAAARFYATRLGRSRKAAEYLRSHGIDAAAEPGTPWSLGYASVRWTDLADHLRGAGFTAEEITAAGLGFTHRTSGHLLDRFRDRLMFPITDEHNRVVAFTARDVSGRADAKWINSPETAIYRKGLVLYGLGQQLAHRPTGVGDPVVFVVEGAADVLAMHRMAAAHATIPQTQPVYAVAPCGTNLTREQLDLLHQRLPGAHLILAFDGDDAGRSALARAYPIAVKWPGQLSGAQLPTGQDPADLLAVMDPIWAMSELTGATKPLAQIVMTHTISRLFETGRITDPGKYAADRLVAYRAIAELFIDAPHASRSMAQSAADQLGLDATDVIRGVIEAWDARTGATSGADPPPETVASSGSSVGPPTPPAPANPRTAAGRGKLSGRGDERITVSASARHTDGRTVDSAAIVSRHDRASGTTVWALADGIGNHPQAATAAAMAAEVAATVTLRSAPAAGLHAARVAVNAFYEGVHASQAGDAALIVISAYPDTTTRHGVRFELAWAGDCRAYTICGGNLAQVTADHTAARQRRDAGEPTPAGSIADLLLTSSVRAGDISVCPLDAGPLLICNNALHRGISPTRLAAELAEISLLIHARTARPAWVTTTATAPQPGLTATGSPATLAKTSFAEAPTSSSPTAEPPSTATSPTQQARPSTVHRR